MTLTRKSLLESLEITKSTALTESITKLENWYSSNVSRQPLYDRELRASDKLNILKDAASHFLSTVAAIPADKCGEVYPNLDNMTAVQYASKHGFDMYLASLAKNGKLSAHVNTPNGAGLSPLHFAALFGHPLTCDVLLDNNAATTSITRLRQTALHSSLIKLPSSYDTFNLNRRKLETFKLLFNANPELLNSVDAAGNTIAHTAVDNGFDTVINQLLDKDARVIFEKNFAQHTPLHSAILAKHAKSIELLASNEILLGIAGPHGRLPIHYAALYGGKTALSIIVAADNNIDAKDEYEKTPIMMAAQQGDLAAVQYLIEQGANLKLLDSHGFNLFHHAVLSLNLELVSWLMENCSIDVNHQDNNGRTALMNVLLEGSLDDEKIGALITLLKNDNAMELCDKQGKSLEDYLPEDGSPKIAI